MKTFLDWSAYKNAGMGDAYADIPAHGDDYAKAVSVCINARQCEEKAAKLVMCPAFRISDDADLSTGGRVRMLKAALNSSDPVTALSEPVLRDAMLDCVACKGCKRECENNVDMALIKSEYLAQYASLNGYTLRARLFAHAPVWLAKYPVFNSLIKWRNQSKIVSWVAEKILGLSRHVSLPVASSKPEQFEPTLQKRNPELPEVVLFVDTFARHYQPEIAESAIYVLTSGGYQVQIAAPLESDPHQKLPLCCGRTYLAQGMIDKARSQARRLIDALNPHIEAGRIIVGLEPSCILGLRDDFLCLDLNNGDPSFVYIAAARKLAKKAFLFEEFLAKEIMAKRLKLPFDDEATHKQALIHGHCHQKAVGAMKSMRKVLKLIPNFDFTLIDADCCGMAGTYGLEAENAEKSRQMVNDRLIPSLNDSPHATVIANGFSCRSQIKNHSGRNAVHIAQALGEIIPTKEGL